MKIIIKYQAKDKREFNTEKECLVHESLLSNIQRVMSCLHAPPDDCVKFANGLGYLQNDPADVEEAKNGIIDLWQGDDAIKLNARAQPAKFSILGRFFSDSNCPLQDPWYRLCCIDDQAREWGQPFFANNPDQGKQVCLNS